MRVAGYTEVVGHPQHLRQDRLGSMVARTAGMALGLTMPLLTICSARPEEGVARIAAMVPAGTRLIRIDGHSGVGKSRLAKALARHGGWRLVQIDDFIDADRPGKYMAKVQRKALYTEICQALGSGTVVVEGLWVDALLPETTFGKSFRICVKSEEKGAGYHEELERRSQFGTDRYWQQHAPDASAHLIVVVPYE